MSSDIPPPSPSSVRWHYDSRGFPKKPFLRDDEAEQERNSNTIPSSEEMQRRWSLRRSIQEESNHFRRVHTTMPKHTSIPDVLKERSIHGGNQKRIRYYGEHLSVTQYESAFLNHLGGPTSTPTTSRTSEDHHHQQQQASSPSAVSTISIAFSSCGSTMASTHGDHTVKISDCYSGHSLQTLTGHPRTPWTCKYHPLKPEIVASGCLGHQVRIWNWKTNTCLAMIRLEFAIISLSFHPSGKLLAIANGTRLHFWGLTHLDEWESSNNTADNRNSNERGMLTEVEQRHMLRCVHFPPHGDTVIVGGVNPADTSSSNTRPRRGGISGGGMSFYLRLWDFNLETTLDRNKASNGDSMRLRAISNPRTFVPRALLYNDGGFDVSPDGKTICACAEYWLPDGVDNAMDLLPTDDSYGDDDTADGIDTSSSAGSGNEGNSILPKTPTPSEGPPTYSPILSSTSINNLSPIQNTTQNTNSSSRQQPLNANASQLPPQTPQTPPPNPSRNLTLSPPSPPGRRFAGGVHERLPPPPPGMQPEPQGRYVPHVVTISLDTTPNEYSTDPNHLQAMLHPPNHPHSPFYNHSTSNNSNTNKKQKKRTEGSSSASSIKMRPRLGQLLQACALDGAKASAVTCVKFSPSTNFCLIGYGVREPIMDGATPLHPVTALYATTPTMTHVSTMLSADDDVNIARFHPHSGMGFCYGTKQGRVKVLGPRPWNYYNC